MRLNQFGQPVGDELDAWTPPGLPSSQGLAGALVHLEPLAADRHASDLMQVFESAPESLWTYLAIGPFESVEDLSTTLDRLADQPNWQAYAVTVDGAALGFASYLRIDQQHGVLEIGSIALSPALQRTTAATEAIYLMIDHAFDLGYRRCEWKCDDLNAPSRAAAERLGFRYEGTFRQATHYKGRNRDTAWFAIVDHEWRELRPAFDAWLSPSNFDEHGEQRVSLREVRQRAAQESAPQRASTTASGASPEARPPR